MSGPVPQEGDYCVVPTKGFVEAHKPCLYFRRTSGRWMLVSPMPPVKLQPPPCGGKIKISLPDKNQIRDFELTVVLEEEMKQFKLLDSVLNTVEGFVVLDMMWDRRVRLHGAAVRLLGEDRDVSDCHPFQHSKDGLSVEIPSVKGTQGVALIFALYDWDPTGTQPNPAVVKKLICSFDPEIQSGA
ncbi:hypothetical protein [Rhizobacter sp. P5_C2]